MTAFLREWGKLRAIERRQLSDLVPPPPPPSPLPPPTLPASTWVVKRRPTLQVITTPLANALARAAREAKTQVDLPCRFDHIPLHSLVYL